MALRMSKDAATIVLLRFFVRQASKGTLIAPHGAYLIAETAEIAWVPYGKKYITVTPSTKQIVELDRTHVIDLEPYIPEVNACFVVLKPVIDPSLSLQEIRLLSRVGIDTTKLN